MKKVVLRTDKVFYYLGPSSSHGANKKGQRLRIERARKLTSKRPFQELNVGGTNERYSDFYWKA